MTLKDKRVAIVGGGSGIGYAVAEACIAEGAAVTIASSNLARVQAAAQRLGGGAQAARVNVTDESNVVDFFANAGGFDHIVTTAGDWGGPRGARLADLDLEAAKSIFNVRFWGALALAKHGSKTLAPGGSITLTDGMVAHRPGPGAFVSSAMAGGIEHLVRGLAVELAPLRVNGVCPGMIRTDVWNSIPEDRREATLAERTKRNLIPRIGEAAECAEAYLYLMRGGYTTGQVLYVEGGSALR
jgi:NAD(P)-dependent dehydrogenase (short-subunit alcohol dehydrogenase family)